MAIHTDAISPESRGVLGTTSIERSSRVPDNNDNGWTEWRKYVLAELKRLNDGIAHNANTFTTQTRLLMEQIAALQVCVARLEVKAGIWGAVAGLIATGVALAAFLIKGLP